MPTKKDLSILQHYFRLFKQGYRTLQAKKEMIDNNFLFIFMIF